MEFWAHRGASDDAPENTLPAIRRGWEQADGVEIDVRLCRDGHIVLMHDETARRTAGLNRQVADLTLVEIQGLDAGQWKGAAFTGVRVPTLGEVLATVPPVGKRLIIEIKCGSEILSALRRSLDSFPSPSERLVIIAFSLETLRQIKRELPHIPALWIVGLSPDAPEVEALTVRAREAGLDGLNVGPSGPPDHEFVRRTQDAGLRCAAWTIDDPTEARRLLDAGVNALTTNRPGWLRRRV